jgi:hypothetical protein
VTNSEKDDLARFSAQCDAFIRGEPIDPPPQVITIGDYDAILHFQRLRASAEAKALLRKAERLVETEAVESSAPARKNFGKRGAKPLEVNNPRLAQIYASIREVCRPLPRRNRRKAGLKAIKMQFDHRQLREQISEAGLKLNARLIDTAHKPRGATTRT